MIEKEMRPIILIGAGRSGTKFLRSLIAASEYVAEIPYDVGYVWRYGNESAPNDEFTVAMLRDDLRQYIRKTIPKLIDKKTLSHKEIFFVEKSVPNTLRVEYVNAIFPDALYIHLIRDGRAVTESSLRMWNTPPEHNYLLKKLKYFPLTNYKYAFWYAINMLRGRLSSKRAQAIWGPRYNNIEEDIRHLPLEIVCARQWKECVEKASSQLSKIEAQRVLEVRYESLMKDPNEINRICEFIGVSDCGLIREKYNDTLNNTNLSKWKDGLTASQMEVVNKEISSLIEKLGY